MSLKPFTFKLEESEIEKIRAEAEQPPRRSPSAYVRDIVMDRHKPKPRLPQRAED